MGATRHFYAEEDVDNIIKNFERGEISKICNEAIREHANSNLSLNSIKRKLSVINQELDKLNSQKKFLESKEAELEKQEKEIQIKEAEKQKNEKFIKKEKVKQMIKNIKDLHNVEDKKLLKEYAEEIVNLNEDVSYLNKVKGVPFKTR
jgi:glutamyl/glutaminyl-tRNA synthetase